MERKVKLMKKVKDCSILKQKFIGKDVSKMDIKDEIARLVFLELLKEDYQEARHRLMEQLKSVINSREKVNLSDCADTAIDYRMAINNFCSMGYNESEAPMSECDLRLLDLLEESIPDLKNVTRT